MDIDIRDVWKIVKKRFLIIAVLTIVVTIVTGWMSLYILNPEYEATAKLLVQSQTPGNGSTFSDVEANKELITTYAEIVKSQRIANDVINTLDLSVSPEDLLKKVDVHANDDSLITSVTVRDDDPNQAVIIANGFAQSFLENVGSIMKVDNVSILDEAVLPDNPVPVRPKPFLNVAVSFVLSLIVGMCLSLMLEIFDQSIKSEEMVEELGLPVLGVVIHFKDKKRKEHAKSRRKRQIGGIALENEHNNEIILP